MNTKISIVWNFITQFVAVLAFLSPIAWWGYSTLDAKAQEYVNEVISPVITDLKDQIEESNDEIKKLTRAINSLSAGQKIETAQSEDEARIGRQILCLQQLQLDPSSGTADGCLNIE